MQGKMYVTPPPKLYDYNNKITGTDGPTKRVYQLWKGSNKFAFGGRFIFGPDVRSMILAIFLIVVPVAIFSIFVSQKLVVEFEQNIAILIVAVAIVFTAYLLCLLFLTSSRDPGIIPRNAHPPELDEDGDASTLSSSWSGSQTGPPNLPPTKDVHVNGFVIKVKYCHTCMLYRPPRCSHCSVCNNCVERFDHHCPWVGQCIGKRNYRFFFMFVSSTTVLCLYIFAFCWVNLKKTMQAHECNLWKAILESPVAGVLIIYTFIAAWFVGGLTVFHMYLICTNQTTYENFRYQYDGKSNPYNRGCFQNIKEIFFSRIPSSQNNFRAKVKQSSAFNKSSLSLQSVSSPDMAKRSVDIEMGGKRQAVADDEIEDIQSQIDSVRGLERCGTQPAHFDQKSKWEINADDLDDVAKALGMEKAYNIRDKIHNSSE